MENIRNKIVEPLKIKGNWDNFLNRLRKHFALLPDVEHKFASPKQNELLSTIEARFSRNQEEISTIIKKDKI